MIILKLRNGIGNQLFVLGFGEYIKQINPSQIIKYDLSELPQKINGRYTVTLESIVEDIDCLTPDLVRKIIGKRLYYHRLYSNSKHIIPTLERKIVSSFIIRNDCVLLYEDDNCPSIFDSYQFSENCNYLIDGYFENTYYLQSIRERMKEIVNFPSANIKKQYLNILNKSQNVVSIHIRRGDYIKESFSNKYPRYYYALCDESYYRKAIQSISEHLQNPIFLCFSDDFEYVRKTYSDVENIVFVQGQKDFEDLYLMTLCKFHILANSTFSFWGAYLSDDAITIAPKTHYYYLENESSKQEHRFFNIPKWIYL